jgi:hypothetical protein
MAKVLLEEGRRQSGGRGGNRAGAGSAAYDVLRWHGKLPLGAQWRFGWLADNLLHGWSDMGRQAGKYASRHGMTACVLT